MIAGPPSAGYRLRKFVRRNRATVLALGAVAAALVVGIVAFAWQAEVARDQRDRAVRAQTAEARQRLAAEAATVDARNQAAIAEAVERFQTDMLEAADPNNLLGDKVTVLQTMEAAEKELDSGALEDQPLVEAGVRRAIGRTLYELARYEAAESNLRKSVTLLREAPSADHPSILRNLNLLSMVLNDQGKRAEAERYLLDALRIARAALPVGHDEIGTTMNNLAMVLHAEHKFTEAEALYREALEIARAAFPVEQLATAAALNNLASVLSAQHQFDEAEPLYREALKIVREALPVGHPDIATSLGNLAVLLQNEGKLTEAEPLSREALSIKRATLPAEHPSLGLAVYNHAWLLVAMGKDAEAEPLLREGLEITRAALPVGHPRLVAMEDSYFTRQVTNACKAAGPTRPETIASVVARLQQCLDQQRGRLAKNSTELAGRLATCSKVLLDLQAWAEAEPLIRESLSIREQVQPDDWSTFNSKSMLGEALLGQNRLVEAEAFLLEGYRGMLERRASMPAGAETRNREALERLVRFFEANGDAVGAAAWRSKLEAAQSEPPTRNASRSK